MVTLFLALGLWLLVISLASFFIARNLPEEEVMIEKAAQAQPMTIPISDTEFARRLEAAVKTYATKKRQDEQMETAKKIEGRKTNRITLGNILPLEMSFYFNNPVKGEGAFARNLDEFLETLKEAPQEVVDFHLREDVNDFEDWVRNIVKDVALADELKKIKDEKGTDKDAIIDAVEKKLKMQKKMLAKDAPKKPKAI